MSDIAGLVGLPEILEQLREFTLFRTHFSDGSTSTEIAWSAAYVPPYQAQRLVIERTLADADAGKITLSASDRAGLEVTVGLAKEKEAEA